MSLKLDCRNGLLPVLLFFLSPAVHSYAQDSTKAVTNSYLNGVVVDNEHQKPLEYATVSIYSLPDSLLVKGTITNRKGEFELAGLESLNCYYRVEYLGFESYSSKPILLKENEKLFLSKPLTLRANTQRITEVEVTGNRDFARIELDKTVYNVSKSPVSDGGTINEVLATIPKLNVTANGGIQLRGSSDVKILIDGKLSGLLGMSPGDVLSNMPAADVDRVEVITSPSAKYDASGSAGIVNIIMKKDRAKGFNGNASATIGTINKHSGRTALNLRTGKLNLSGSYSYRNDWSGRDYELSRFTEIDNNVEMLNSRADVDLGDRSHIGQLGMDYLINDKNTVSFSVTNRNVKQNRNGIYNYSRNLITSSTFSNETSRESAVDIDLNSWVYNASYIRKFDRKGQEFSFDASYTRNKAENYGNYTDEVEGNTSDFFNSNREEAIIQMDYKQPLGEVGSIETGYLYRTNEIKYNEPIDLSTAFNYKESIHGLYFQFSGEKGDFGYQFGLRSEYSDIETNKAYNDDYLDFFPSVHLSYKLSDNKQVLLTYSKMVYRPDSRMLNPFQNLQDPENQRLGSKELGAYYTHMPELTFVYKRDKITYTTNLYYQYKDNIIRQYRSVNESNVAIVTYENVGNLQYAGVDFNISTKFNKWWSVNSYLSGIYQKYTPSAKVSFSTNDDFGFFGKLTSTMRIPKWFNFQTTLRYDSDMPVVQGNYDQSFQVDFAFGKRIMKGKASISLWIYDVLNSSKYNVNTSGDRFTQRMKYNFENRVANLTFRYNFGKKYNVLKTKKRGSGVQHSEKDI
ncbi:outer membrane beta-barrel protein [Labilibaculum sp. A4]|uniref:outer membrane beta-barrel family protein n=1 Tax=Labilibaculum euxinus TaxID=2686357 RepID=UPI000F62412A|nr:outer membrane beta-barrel family protein [Labilibaculum euxinus]MDQ1770573.1 TonB-dependent receptor [Labilibaculum euxinus]MWN75208.1 outer membrane beta-barrel protein [Labilibaculum euxinus]